MEARTAGPRPQLTTCIYLYCWNKQGNVIGSVSRPTERPMWLARIELGSFKSEEEALSAVEAAWTKVAD